MANYYTRTRLRRQRRTRRAVLAAGVSLVLLGLLLAVGLRYVVSPPESPTPAPEAAAPAPGEAPAAGADAGDPQAAPPPAAGSEPSGDVQLGVVERGQTIGHLLGEYFSPQELNDLVAQTEPIFPLSRLTAGHAYAIVSSGQEFRSFAYEVSRSERLHIQRLERGYDIGLSTLQYDVELRRVAGTIASSLFEAVEAAGEADELALRLAKIFEYDIDFLKDLRAGDRFSLLVEKRSHQGQPMGYGRILAAEFVSQGQPHQAFLFDDEEGGSNYYDARGRALRKGFLKAPLEFRRISSTFTMRRLHPILGIVRPHPGIDYAAPVGTPVRTVADGAVSAVARDNAAGNYVKVRHSGGYETSYMHLSGFARGLAVGRTLRQGEVLGYVGATGYATGPHLDFRVRLNGVFVNPASIKVMTADAVPARSLSAFQAQARQLAAELAADAPALTPVSGPAPDQARDDSSPPPPSGGPSPAM